MECEPDAQSTRDCEAGLGRIVALSTPLLKLSTVAGVLQPSIEGQWQPRYPKLRFSLVGRTFPKRLKLVDYTF
jgi:hypothetical protein